MTGTQAPKPWLITFRPNPIASLRLICFHYAGGGASVFRPWVASMPPTVELAAVQLPGREARLRETPLTHVNQVLDALMPALLNVMDRPVVFFGHSMGALIAFELARRLRREGRTLPQHLFVSGHRAPQLPDPNPPIHQLPEPEFITEMRRFNGTPEEVLAHPELMQLFVPILRADLTIVETYTYSPEPPLPCPITALGGMRDDDRSTRDLMEPWREQTSASSSVVMFPGDHFFIRSDQASLLPVIVGELTRLANSAMRR